MPYKSGSWGKQAKARAKKRNQYFLEYNRQRDPVKKQARKDLESAVRRGEMKRGLCRDCGSSKVQAHHPDYLRPLDVIWLCSRHHREIHLLK